MASEEKYNEIAGINKKEQEKRESEENRERFAENLKEDVNKITKPAHESKLTFDDSVVEKIAAIACNEVSGVLDMKGGFFSGISEQFGGYSLTKGINAEVGEKEAAIDASIILEYGHSAPKVFEELKRNISQSVGQMTGLKVVEVNVRVDDVMTRKEFELKKRKENQPNDEYEQRPNLR
ncbi:Asp23/Gls24 family envelope stress response protein [Lagierella sp.]|uniref:Asp23/Gls24 family envelope stress response protein n=1 Tax=Lagierella sp. TaxID=2849657 RepID=UPI00260AA411|nr:Asp23/Gls24 family envelope stress response protein [Lagierella sp.]